MTTQLWLPTRPYSLIDAINRLAAATGSPRYARLASHADYNGHRVSVTWNSYRRYWIAEYTWAGRVVLARGSFADCARAAAAEHARGALGSTVVIYGDLAEADVAAATALGYQPHSKEIEAAHDATWRDARYAEVGGAFRYEQQLGAPAIALLQQSATVEDYRAALDSYFAEQRAARTAR